MTAPAPDHAFIHENMAAYLADALDPAQRAAFDAHINNCPECFDAFSEARDADRALQRTLAGLAPDPKLEDQITSYVRETTMNRWQHPALRRAAYATAAAVALAATGVFANFALHQDGRFNNPLTRQLVAQADAASPALAKRNQRIGDIFVTDIAIPVPPNAVAHGADATHGTQDDILRNTLEQRVTARAALPASRPGVDLTSTMSFHFENATVDTILDEMSRRFGFIIVRTNQMANRVSVSVPNPVNADEAVRMLNNLLVPLGYSTLETRTGQGADAKSVLRIATIAEAKKAQIPVYEGADPDKIPLTDNIITQIIPLKNVAAVGLRNDLTPLLSADADVTANSAANAIVITDTSAKIHRLVEIVQKLDNQKSIKTAIEYKQLTGTSAADAAKTINSMFGTPQGQSGGATFNPGGATGAARGGTTGRAGTLVDVTRVYADADARTNTVVLNGPADQVEKARAYLNTLDSFAGNANPSQPGGPYAAVRSKSLGDGGDVTSAGGDSAGGGYGGGGYGGGGYGGGGGGFGGGGYGGGGGFGGGGSGGATPPQSIGNAALAYNDAEKSSAGDYWKNQGQDAGKFASAAGADHDLNERTAGQVNGNSLTLGRLASADYGAPTDSPALAYNSTKGLALQKESADASGTIVKNGAGTFNFNNGPLAAGANTYSDGNADNRHALLTDSERKTAEDQKGLDLNGQAAANWNTPLTPSAAESAAPSFRAPTTPLPSRDTALPSSTAQPSETPKPLESAKSPAADSQGATVDSLDRDGKSEARSAPALGDAFVQLPKVDVGGKSDARLAGPSSAEAPATPNNPGAPTPVASDGRVVHAVTTNEEERLAAPTVASLRETDGDKVLGSLLAAATPAQTPAPGTTAPTTAPAPATPPSTETTAAVNALKIIRNGTIEFEVRSFDDTYRTVTLVSTEERGFVSSTASEKLANGHVRGTIVVRIPPENLDRFLLKIRALGDLKAQQIGAADVTKQYYDIESELRGLTTMETRLLDLIKTGNGEVKDLIEAEKQLGDTRVRIEKLKGEISYYNNLVSLATITITAYEKDIASPTAASEQEIVAVNVETEEVEAKYQAARKIFDDAKGRIVESQLKNTDAEHIAAHIVADVPPDQADFVANQLKQLGKIASFNRDRKQTTTGGTGTPQPGVSVEKKDTRFTIELFNLANLAPRETTVIRVAVRDVESSYKETLALVKQPPFGTPFGVPPLGGPPAATTQPEPPASQPAPAAAQLPGRVLSSNLTGQQPDQMSADIRAEVRADNADAILAAIRSSGQVLTGSLNTNQDNANTTSAKRGIQLTLVNIASVNAKEADTLNIAVRDVDAAYKSALASIRKSAPPPQSPAAYPAAPEITLLPPTVGRILSSTMTGNQPAQLSADIRAEIRADQAPDFLTALRAAGEVLSNSATENPDTVNVTRAKRGLQVHFINIASVNPKEADTLNIAVRDVDAAYKSALALIRKDAPLPAPNSPNAHMAVLLPTTIGQVLTSTMTGTQPAQLTADIRAEIRADQDADLLTALRASGEILSNSATENPDTVNVTRSKRGLQVHFVNVAAIAPREVQELHGVAASVADSYRTLLSALQDMAAKGDVRLVGSSLSDSDPRSVNARLTFEAQKTAVDGVEKAFTAAGIEFPARSIVRSADTTSTLDSKVGFSIADLRAAETLDPKRTITMGVEVDDVERAVNRLKASVSALGPKARESDFNVNHDAAGRVTAHIVLDTYVSATPAVLDDIVALNGLQTTLQETSNSQAPQTKSFTKERIDLTLTSHAGIVSSNQGVGTSARAALSSAAGALLYSMYLVLTGALFLLPFLIIVWPLWSLLKRRKARKPQPTA